MPRGCTAASRCEANCGHGVLRQGVFGLPQPWQNLTWFLVKPVPEIPFWNTSMMHYESATSQAEMLCASLRGPVGFAGEAGRCWPVFSDIFLFFSPLEYPHTILTFTLEQSALNTRRLAQLTPKEICGSYRHPGHTIKGVFQWETQAGGKIGKRDKSRNKRGCEWDKHTVVHFPMASSQRGMSFPRFPISKD